MVYRVLLKHSVAVGFGSGTCTWPIISIYDTRSCSSTFKEMRDNSVLAKAMFHLVVLLAWKNKLDAACY